ncbi:MAG: hypothetical protein ABI647_18500 [Gemmatimonadota bacterium]
MTSNLSARFVVSAESRHPRLGVDYARDEDPPHYTHEYLNPSGYRIFVDAFPGVIIEPKGDQQASPGHATPMDQWQLLVPEGTIGFEFTLSGQRERTPVGPLRPVAMTARTELRTIRGSGTFREHGPAAAWQHTFEVPGPGSYQVTAAALSERGPGRARSTGIVVRDILIVSVGDSAASGEGNPDTPGRPAGFDRDLGWLDVGTLGAYTVANGLYTKLSNLIKQKLTTLNRALSFTMEMDPKPVWLEPRAHRSLLSGHALAARMVERARPGTLVTFLPFGRSGASIRKGLIGAGRGSEDHFIDNLPEVDEVARTVGKRRIEALLIYVGINDIGITSVLTSLTEGDGIIWLPFAPFGDDGAHRAAALARAKNVIANEFPSSFKDLAEEIEDRLNVRHVFLCEYPSGLFDDQHATPQAGCGLFASDFDMDISSADARTMQEIADELNAGLKVAVDAINSNSARRATSASAPRWFFVKSISNRTRGRGYCTDDWIERLYIQAEESLGFQGDTEGTVHPNSRGHTIIAEEITKLLLEETIDDPFSTDHQMDNGRVFQGP